MEIAAWAPQLFAVAGAPLLQGVINRTKALFAGRQGPPLFQAYFDLSKLLKKGAVYSRTTSWVFRAGPMIGLAAVLTSLALVPLGSVQAPLAFDGDMVLLVYLLGLMRLFTVLAALDTGSPFEGMGASREVQYSALAEPALLLGLAALARQTHSLSLSEIFNAISSESWRTAAPVLVLVSVAFLVVLLAENARIPVDDPNTHLELTMIHEVMVLDHGGPDFAFILYGAALKLWIFAALLLGIVLPLGRFEPWLAFAMSVAGMLIIAVLVGIVESSMARLRLLRVPQLLVGAGAFSALALLLVLK